MVYIWREVLRMILGDMLNRIDDSTDVIVLDSKGKELCRYDGRDSIDESLNDFEVIFPISVSNNKLNIWIEK